MSKQLVLDLKLKETHTLDNFIAGNNQLLLMLLSNMAQKQGEQQLFVWGERILSTVAGWHGVHGSYLY